MEAAAAQLEEVPEDALAALEARIVKAVELVESLRQERDAALIELSSVKKFAGSASLEQDKLRKELDDLRADRKQVRTRIEKLLAQVESLG